MLFFFLVTINYTNGTGKQKTYDYYFDLFPQSNYLSCPVKLRLFNLLINYHKFLVRISRSKKLMLTYRIGIPRTLPLPNFSLHVILLSLQYCSEFFPNPSLIFLLHRHPSPQDTIQNTPHISYIVFQLMNMLSLSQSCFRIFFLNQKHEPRISFLVLWKTRFHSWIST